MMIHRPYLTIFLFFISSTISLPASAQYDSIRFDDQNRTFLLHLPKGYDTGQSYSLIIAMHGGFGSAMNLQNQSQLSKKADAAGFIVVYPEGVKGGALNIRTWNAGWCCGYASRTRVDDVGFISALIDHLVARYAVDAKRIYATGMSNGGFMAYTLACELSDKIAAIAPVAASMSMTSCNPERSPVPIIHFHSYKDTNVPYLGGQGSGTSKHHNSPQDSVMDVWALSNGCDIPWDTVVHNDQYTFTKKINCACQSEIHRYLTRDGGHSWPGGRRTVTGNPVSKYINANDLMWAFFQKYSLECVPTATNNIKKEPSVSFELYPNPTIDVIRIRLSQPVNKFKVIIYNSLGQPVLSQDNTTMVDLTGQMPGMYMLTLKMDQLEQSKKLVIVR